MEGPVDLASISVPARAVPGVMQECLNHGLTGVQIHSSGFSETGEPEGLALEAEIARIATNGLRVVGPNCFGIHCPKGGITVLPGSGFSKESGPVAMISQSGGVATDFGYEARHLGLGLSKVVSFGNGCDLDAVKLLDYLTDDPETRFIAAYMEGVGNGRRFLDLVKETTRKKPMVVWKAGLTPLGGRAARSHTGALGGSARVWDGALSQAGAASVQGLDEMMDTLAALKYLRGPCRNIALMGGGGAIGVFSSDLAYRWGLNVPTFSRETQKRLRKFFPTPGNSMANPLDTGTPALPVDTLLSSAREILAREPVDVLIIIILLRTLEVELPNLFRMNGTEPPPGGSYLKSLLETLSRLKGETGKEVVMVFDNRAYQIDEVHVEAVSRELRHLFQSEGLPVYPSAERALRGILHASTALKFHQP